MAISIDWGTKVIYVPQSYLTSVGGGVYELDINQFRLDLKDLEDSEAGMSHPTTHNHNTEVSLGGVTYARIVEIINGYTVTFENGSYAVRLAGANSNIEDVTNVNNVSVRSNNSAGLVTIDVTNDLVNSILSASVEAGLDLKSAIRLLAAVSAGKISGAPGPTITIRNVGDTKDRVTATVDGDGNRTAITYDTGD